ncbi:hypothetical protein FGO68_gene7295 [Halteria grandinella]|uniref:Uncharacterized protein n=1 Tax=Halteria grandinella TaxID=5974 RepID=A0A8J8P4C4_HALGN|nr:hypothetical protein FGO68_gene7295 [Halteria grandinella]
MQNLITLPWKIKNPNLLKDWQTFLIKAHLPSCILIIQALNQIQIKISAEKGLNNKQGARLILTHPI